MKPNLTVEVAELAVPEGSGKLLIVRVPKGPTPPYGTSKGLYTKRVGKNCMPLDPQSFVRAQITTGALDWSGEAANGVTMADVDPLELARARSVLRSKNPESDLLRLKDSEFLNGLGAVREGRLTNTGLLLFGKQQTLSEACPQNQIHYVHQPSETAVSRNDIWRFGLLLALERIEQIFSGPANPEEELSLGLYKLRIPAYPLDAVREAALNALTHRDYSDPNEVLIRHSPRELALTSPGGFVGGITAQNILRHEPVPRNRTLANAFVKLRLVESAGVGRKRIFIPALSYGKRMPEFSSDGHRVTLNLFNLGYDRNMAALVSRWKGEGREIGLDELIVLGLLRQNAYVDVDRAADILQMDRDEGRQLLDQMSLPGTGILERKGHTKTATYHLQKGVAKDLIGKAGYTRNRGIDQTRFAELVRNQVHEFGRITNKDCRDLLGLGDSKSAIVEASRYLKRWSGKDGFLDAVGKPPTRFYRLRQQS